MQIQICREITIQEGEMNVTIPLPITCKELVTIIKTSIVVSFAVCLLLLFSNANPDIKIMALLVGVVVGIMSLIIGLDHLVEKGSPVKFMCKCDNND